MSDFNQTLRDAKLSKAAFARLAGISIRTVHGWIKNKRAPKWAFVLAREAVSVVGVEITGWEGVTACLKREGIEQFVVLGEKGGEEGVTLMTYANPALSRQEMVWLFEYMIESLNQKREGLH